MKYSNIDEFYYTIGGFNIQHYGTFLNPDVPFTERDAGPFNILQDLVTSVSLAFFGNNFYGLRASSLIASLLILFLMCNIIKHTCVSQQIEHKGIILYSALLFICFDFSFVYAGRVAEPGIMRVLGLVFLTWLFTLDSLIIRKPMLFSFIAGAAAMGTVWFIYLYNLFIVAAAGAAILLIYIPKRKLVFKAVTGFVAGSLACSICFEIFVRINFNQSFINYFTLLGEFTERVGHEEKNLFSISYNTIIRDLSTNIFRFNLPFLLTVLTLFPVFCFRVIKKKRPAEIFIMLGLIVLFLQTLFENSYYEKRHVVIFCSMVLLIIYSVDSVPEFAAWLKTKTRRLLFLLFFSSVFVLVAIVTKSFYFNSAKGSSFQLLFFLNVVLLLPAALVICRGFAGMGNFKALFPVLALTGLLYSFQYFIVSPTFKYKDASRKMSSEINDKVLAGGISFGFRLYNTSVPVLNSYAWHYHQPAEYKKRMRLLFNGPAEFIILYSGPGDKNEIPGVLNELTYGQNFTFVPVDVYDIGYEKITLYKKIIHDPI